ncbi:hypothetical protein FQN57_001299 [Myotisia sp. PD_48]|nr:hypothetical protein FQN57_001299 [Myotisia sp. PD_48]
MADTCIVCLGDLGEEGISNFPEALNLPRPPDHENNQQHHDVVITLESAKEESTTTASTAIAVEEVGNIAHLLPCGHNLHNDCLKPWVERANSCPICRQNFNVVELVQKIGGPVLSSYVVEDRVQVADIDPFMIIDDLPEETEFLPCPVCGDDDNEAVLLLCDGCNVASHTYCVGLDSVPAGDWYCANCETQRALAPQPTRPPRTRPSRRTREDQRRDRNRSQMHAFHWARVWQSVWDQLNLDLDFPFDDEQAADRILQHRRRDASNRREFRAWERRFRIAERQGGPNRFRDTAPALFEMRRGWPSRPRQRIETPEPESVDEVRAWNAFERAKEIDDGPNPNPNRRKRKSPTASPIDPEPNQPERKLKRPRTKRPEALPDMLEHSGEPSSSRTRQLDGQDSSKNISTNLPQGPSFLQSLLKEVEASSTPNNANSTYRLATAPSTTVDMGSSGPSSPARSHLSSSPSSSRPSSITPPPHKQSKSPTISPAISEPTFSSPEFSPSWSSPTHDPAPTEQTRSRSRLPAAARTLNSNSPLSRFRSRSNETSPTRDGLPGLSLSVKSDLQKLVSTVLKPFYRRKEVSKEQYTDINRRISRLLYDQVDSTGALDSETKSKLAVIASNEVNKAVTILRELRHHDTSGNSSGG